MFSVISVEFEIGPTLTDIFYIHNRCSNFSLIVFVTEFCFPCLWRNFKSDYQHARRFICFACVMIASFVQRVLSRALTLVWRHANRHSKLGLGLHHMTSDTFMLFHIISFEFGNLHRVSPQEIELKQLLTSSEGVDAMYRYLARGPL